MDPLDDTVQNLTRDEIDLIVAEYRHHQMMEHLVGPMVSMIVHVILVIIAVFFISFDGPPENDAVEISMMQPEDIQDLENEEPPEPPPDPEIPVIDMETPPTDVPSASMESFADIGGEAFSIPGSASPYRIRVPAGGSSGSFGFGKTGKGGVGGAGSAFAGRLYYLEKTRDGAPIREFIGGGKSVSGFREKNYARILEGHVQYICGMSPDSPLWHYYIAQRDGSPVVLYTSGFFVQRASSALGPKRYGVENQVGPRSWFAHYKANVKAGRDMTFRFAGMGQAMLIVLVNKQVALIGCYDPNPWIPSKRRFLKSFNWIPSRPANQTSWLCDDFKPVKASSSPVVLKFGDWITVKKGEVVAMDVLAGDVHTSLFGMVLCVEEKGWKPTPSGRPKLALFSTRETLKDRLPKDIKKRVNAGHFVVNEGMLGPTSKERFQAQLSSVNIKVD